MNLKIGAPIAGIVGTFTGVFGLGGGINSTLDPDSGRLVVKNLSDSWKLKVVEPVEVSYICNGRGNTEGKITGTFNVKVDVSAFTGKEEKLTKREKVDVRVGFGFNVSNAQDSLRGLGKREAWMTVSNNWYGGLDISLKEWKGGTARNSDVNLSCQIASSSGASELREYKNSNEIFSGKIEVDDSKGTVTLKDWGGSLRASLYNCQPKAREGDSFACDLKLTDLSSWRWSVKASQKAKFEPSSAQS